jgi:hypothetical protein
MSRLLIIFGLVLVALGLLWPWIGKLGLGHLPGDIVIERENFCLYVPLATSLVIQHRAQSHSMVGKLADRSLKDVLISIEFHSRKRPKGPDRCAGN